MEMRRRKRSQRRLWRNIRKSESKPQFSSRRISNPKLRRNYKR